MGATQPLIARVISTCWPGHLADEAAEFDNSAHRHPLAPAIVNRWVEL